MAYTPLGKTKTSSPTLIGYQPIGRRFSIKTEEEELPTSGKIGAGKAFTRAAAFQAVPTTGAIASGVLGAKVGATVGLAGGPIGAAIGGVVGAVGGGILGAVLTSKAQEKALEIVKGDEWLAEKQKQLSEARKERPLATLAGEVAPQLLTLKPSPQTVVRSLKFAQQVLTKPKTISSLIKTPQGKAQLDDLINVSVGGSAELGTEIYTQAKEGDFNAIRLIAAGTVGSLINQPNRFGMRIGLKPSGEVEVMPEVTPERRVPVRSEAEESFVPIRGEGGETTPRDDLTITPEDQLPTIEFGRAPRTEGISPETPLRTAVDIPVEQRLANLTPEQNREVLRETRRLFGRGMDYETARETALARFEAETPTGETRIVPEPTETPAKASQETPQAPTRLETPEAEVIAPETRTTRVLREQLPVGEGKTRVSRLEARMKSVLDDVPLTKAEEAGITTYRQMNKAEQIKKATDYVDKNPDDALAVLRGDKPAPEGILHNSIALALEQKAAQTADANLAIKLGSLRSTRAGQEISILTEADPSNPVNAIQEIIKARTERVRRKTKTEPTKEISKQTKEVSSELTKQQLKIEEAEKLLNSLTC